MKAENIKRAGQIGDRLEILNAHKDVWIKGDGFRQDGDLPIIKEGIGKTEFTSTNFLNFDVCKAIAIAAIEKEIDALNKELETL